MRWFCYRYRLVRYEDLAGSPQRYVRDLYAFLDLPYTAQVASTVVELTIWSSYLAPQDTLEHPFSTQKNATATAMAWRNRLPFEKVQEIQQECEEVLRAYGYWLFTSRGEYEDLATPAVLPLGQGR